MNVTGDKNYLILVPRLAPAATTRQHPACGSRISGTVDVCPPSGSSAA